MEPLDVSALLDGAQRPLDSTSRRILDAAYEEILAYGLRRSRVEDVTRRARVGRMTVHRRYPTKQALVGAVFLDQIRQIMDAVAQEMAGHDEPADRLAHGLAVGIHLASINPLFSRVLDTDPESMLPYLTTQAQPLMILVVEVVAAEIAFHPEARRVAETIIRFSHSILLLPRGTSDLSDPEALVEFLRPAVAALLAA